MLEVEYVGSQLVTVVETLMGLEKPYVLEADGPDGDAYPSLAVQR